MKNGLTTFDWIVIAGYFGLLLVVAWWAIRQKNTDSEDYFLAGRNIGLIRSWYVYIYF